VRQRHGELGERFVVVSRWILTVNLPIAVCLLLVGDSILQLYAADKVEDLAYLSLAMQVLLVLCVGMMVQGVFAVAEPLLAMSGRPGLNFANNSLWLAMNFGLNLWLIEAYGAVGAAVGASVSMMLINLVRVGQVVVVRGVWPFRRSMLKPLAAAAIAAAPTAWLRDAPAGPLWGAVVPCLVFLGVYGGGLLLLRLEAEDRMLLQRLRRRLQRRSRGAVD
jgi:O-antigen/teichoic acid export membrane protein